MNKSKIFIGLNFALLLLLCTASNKPEFNYLPSNNSSNEIIKHTHYTLSYSEKHEQPEWVAYELKPEMLHKIVDRKDNFRPDSSVSTGTPTYDDYNSAKDYDTGHMLCCRNMQFSCESMDETFFTSNMSPQHKELNRKRWAHLEWLERCMVERNGSLYVVCGGVLKDIEKWIGIDNKIAVPKYYYKVILKHTEEETKCIGFLFPNRLCEKKLNEYVVSIDSIESFTGIDFFPSLPDDIEDSIEKSKNKDKWSFKKTRSKFGYDKEAVKCTN